VTDRRWERGGVAPRRPVVVSVWGAAGSGKSRLAKALAAQLEDGAAARVPTDYFLVPVAEGEPLAAYLGGPLRYDWALFERTVAARSARPSRRRISTSKRSAGWRRRAGCRSTSAPS